MLTACLPNLNKTESKVVQHQPEGKMQHSALSLTGQVVALTL